MDAPALHPVDLLVALKLLASGDPSAPVRRLEETLGVSKSVIAQSIHRLLALGILRAAPGGRRVNRLALRDCLVHATRWIAPATVGDWELGLPTAHSAAALSSKLRGDGDVVVMPLSHGPVRGRAVRPIHPKAPEAAAKDPRLHQLLALVDVFRIGRARDREIADKELAAWA